jgi:hypothetical protein
MTKLRGTQLSLIAELGTEDRPVGDWDYDELGTNKYLVPNSSIPELGTNKILVPNFTKWDADLSDWQPPIGCLQQKWIKDHQYWYWRYYDNRHKKRSLYLGKDYNKAVRKAIKIGLPTDAKIPNLPTTNPQTITHSVVLSANAATAHPA